MKRTALFTALLGVAAVAQAGTVTFDPFPSIPSDVTVGYFAGGLTGPLASLPTPVSVGLASTPSAIPSGGSALLLYQTSTQFGPYGMLLTFASLQRYVQATGNDFGGDPSTDNEIAHLSLFDGAGLLLGSASFSSPWASPNLKQVSFDAGSSLIKYAAFTWTDDLGYYSVDDVVYRGAAVPEPGTLVLLGLGLAGLGLSRRRRAH